MKSQIIFYEKSAKSAKHLVRTSVSGTEQLIVDSCDILPAIWDGKSRGTKNTLGYARKVNKPAFLIEFSQESKKSS